MDAKQARMALDDIVAALNRNPTHVLGSELVRRFVEHVYIPQKYENGDWRKATGQEAERLFRRYVLPDIGEIRCRDLKAENLRGVLRKLAVGGLSRGPVSQVKCAMGDMVKMAVAEGYITSNIAEALKTPRMAHPSDRSLLRRITLPDYLRAWNALEERERLAFDLVTFCGLRESEAYGLQIGDLFQQGAIRVQRSWFRGSVNPTKTNKVRNVAIEAEIFERLTAWIAGLPDRSREGWVFASEGIVTPLLADNVIRRWIRPRLEQLNLGWVTFAVLRRSHSTLHKEKGTDPKVIADQQGHGLGVHMAEYVESSLAVKREAVSALWADFKALRSEAAISN